VVAVSLSNNNFQLVFVSLERYLNDQKLLSRFLVTVSIKSKLLSFI
jgi:hypothetical protein